MIDEDFAPDDPPSDDPEDGIVNAADAKQHRKRETRVKLEKREADAFWRAVLSDPVGRREMWRLLQEAHTFDTRFGCTPTGFPQVEATWRYLGEQDFGQRLYQTWLCLDPQLVADLHREHDPRFAKPAKARKRDET